MITCVYFYGFWHGIFFPFRQHSMKIALDKYGVLRSDFLLEALILLLEYFKSSCSGPMHLSCSKPPVAPSVGSYSKPPPKSQKVEPAATTSLSCNASPRNSRRVEQRDSRSSIGFYSTSRYGSLEPESRQSSVGPEESDLTANK